MSKKFKPMRLGYFPMWYDYVPIDKIEDYCNKFCLYWDNDLCPEGSRANCIIYGRGYNDDPLALITISNNVKHDAVTIPTYFSHEIVHILKKTWDHIKEPEPGEEVVAYATQDVMNNLLHRFIDYHGDFN